MAINLQTQFALLPPNVRLLFDDVDLTEPKDNLSGELVFVDQNQAYRRQVRALTAQLVEMTLRGASEAELQFTAVATLNKIKELKKDFFAQSQFYQTNHSLAEDSAHQVTRKLHEMSLGEGFPGFRVSPAECQEGLAAVKLGALVVDTASEIIVGAAKSVCSIHPRLNKGCHKVYNTVVEAKDSLFEKSGFSEFLKSHREAVAAREPAAISAMRDLCGSEMSDDMIRQGLEDTETTLLSGAGYGIARVGVKTFQKLGSIRNKLPPAAKVYNPKDVGLANFMQGAVKKTTVLEGCSYEVLPNESFVASEFLPGSLKKLPALPPVAATKASSIYSPRMEDIIGKMQSIIKETSGPLECSFVSLQRQASVFEKFLPVYPLGSSSMEMERVWLSAIAEHTFPFSTTSYEAKYFKGWEDKTVVKLSVADRAYVVKTSAIDPGILTEVEGLSTIKNLDLKYLHVPNLVVLAKARDDTKTSKMFVAKDWVEGLTFSDTMSKLGKDGIDSFSGVNLFKDFESAYYVAGKATGELHRKTSVINAHTGSIAMEAVTESFSRLLEYTNVKLGQLLVPAINQKNTESLLQKVKTENLPNSYGFYDIHGEQFVWKKIESTAGKSDYEFWWIDVEHGPVTFTAKKDPLSVPIIEYHNFLFSIEEMGQAEQIASDKITLLKDAFCKGYISEYVETASQETKDFFQIRSSIRSIQNLAVPYTAQGKSMPSAMYEKLLNSVKKLNHQLEKSTK